MSRYDLDRSDLDRLLGHLPSYRAKQVWQGLYQRGVGPQEMTDLPIQLRHELGRRAELAPALELAIESRADDNKTYKWLWELSGGARIETVLMHYRSRSTVCVSTQAGCAMACGFCATGQAGFTRQLSVGEIVEQVVRARRSCLDQPEPKRLSNVVFMGMGEPLANYDRVWGAVERIHSHLGLSARHLTISTVGVVPGIRRLSAAGLPVNLAVSLHAANDSLRDRLVPINKRYPLMVLLEACAGYIRATGRRLSFEWALIDGVNDTAQDASELAGLARPIGAHVNLIPLNPTPGWPTRGTPAAQVSRFRDQLSSLGVNATVRRNRGNDIDAACGQLAAPGHTVAVALPN
ncbi:MAG: 23S rRNA (adenine(2503)-C(2))-methyltransferase RlmN [Acidimicrobiales bacterium]